MNRTKNLAYPQGSSPFTLNDFKQMAQSGTALDVDCLMDNLDTNPTFIYCKMIDYALGLVSTPEGRERICHFLFNGSQIQKNYAALYLKRRGDNKIIAEAVRRGCIDTVQAYSR